MKGKGTILWTAAVAVTLFSAAWQRATGPTHPYRGTVIIGNRKISFVLPRSHPGAGDQLIRLEVPDTTIRGELIWRRYPTNDPWNHQPLKREGKYLVGHLPHQPPAGKLEYEIQLRQHGEAQLLTKKPVVIRFRGDVPTVVLVAHILAMFLFMLFSNRSGLEALVNGERARLYGLVGFLFLILGGFVLGPAVQHYAFGQWWTGVPFGYDLTDNKTLIAAVVWLIALLRSRKGRQARWSYVVAALVTLGAFLIPHSAWGSEIKWEELPQGSAVP